MSAPSPNSPTFIRAMPSVARALLGEPPEAFLKKTKWRYGNNGSLAVNLHAGTWFDHEANIGGGVLDLVQSKKGLDQEAAIEWLKKGNHLPDATPRQKAKIVATYDYQDDIGMLLFQVVRLDPKTFRQRRPDGAGGWLWKMDGVQRVLYRLPQVVAAVHAGAAIYIVEGEKAADRLAAFGVPATCSPGGANKWQDQYSRFLIGADVVILPDNDRPGREHAAMVSASLLRAPGGVKRIRVLALPGLADKADVADWLADGGTVEELAALTVATGDARPSDFIDAAPRAATVVSDAVGPYAAPVHHDTDDARSPEFSDDALAVRFTTRHKGTLRYVAAWGRWYIFDGSRWAPDGTMATFNHARAVCRQASEECNKDSTAAGIASSSTVGAVERLARADRHHAATVEQWDADPWLLNTPGGMIDLRTGKTRPHRAEDYQTKITAVPCEGDCPIWRAFLARVTNGDKELQLFLQRMMGYALTGNTREHALFFFYGTGGNGKGVFLNTLTAILGEYAAIAGMETFTASGTERHPTDLAMLRGARLVTAQETEEGRRWAEAKIKAMTGGDPITARFMRQDFFTFSPQFKLIIAGNHKPGLRSVDEAIRRRFNLVPFAAKITAEERDPELLEKLRAEWPGILQWAVDGCMLWQERGLAAPASVTEATDEYLGDEDAIASWLAACCIMDKHLISSASTLFASWRGWAETAGELAGSQKRFSQALLTRGMEPVRGRTERGFSGIGLHAQPGRHEAREYDL